VSGVEYVPVSEPLTAGERAALAAYLDGQSRIRAAYEVGMRFAPAADGTRLADDLLWFELGEPVRARHERRALSIGLHCELPRVLARRLRRRLDRSRRPAGGSRVR
jgi:hypothetical protein